MIPEYFPLKEGDEVKLKLLHLENIGLEEEGREEILLVDVEDVNKKYARYELFNQKFEEKEQYLPYENLEARVVNYHVSRLQDRYIGKIKENSETEGDHLEVAKDVDPARDSNGGKELDIESNISRLASSSDLEDEDQEDNEAHRSEDGVEEKNNNNEEDNGIEEEEDEYNEEALPYDPKKIRVDEKNFSLRQIKDLIDDGDIDLQPDYQRAAVWNRKQNSRLIESILLRIPLPAFYFSKDEEGKYQVIDGQQRLTAIHDYMKNNYILRGMAYLTSVNYKGGEVAEGCCYEDSGKNKKGLSDAYRRCIDASQIHVHVIDPSSPPPLKYEIFSRLNTGGVVLNAQEIRNCFASNALRKLLKDMSRNEHFLEATDGGLSTKPKVKRMKDQEAGLRFLSYRRLLGKGALPETEKIGPTTLMSDTSDELSKCKAHKLERYKDLFNLSMKNAAYLFGAQAFRRHELSDLDSGVVESPKKGSRINIQLFVAWSLILSCVSLEELKEAGIRRHSFARVLAKAMDEDREFFELIDSGHPENIRSIFGRCAELLEHPVGRKLL